MKVAVDTVPAGNRKLWLWSPDIAVTLLAIVPVAASASVALVVCAAGAAGGGAVLVVEVEEAQEE